MYESHVCQNNEFRTSPWVLPSKKEDAEKRVLLPWSPELTDHIYSNKYARARMVGKWTIPNKWSRDFLGFFCLLGVFHPNNLSYYSSPSNTAKNYDHQHTLMRNELWIPSQSFRKAFRRNKYFQCVPVPALGFAMGPDFVLE